MKEKRRLNRVQWVNNASAGGAEPVESSATPWATPPIQASATSWGATAMESNPTPWATSQAENNPTPWGTTPAENNPAPWSEVPGESNATPWMAPRAEEHSAPWAMSAEENDSPPEQELAEENHLTGEEAYDDAYAPSEYDPQAEEVYEDEMYEDEFYEDEEAFLEQQRLLEEAERRTLRDALLILVALYIVCGIAPLFMGLFVPLRTFFWLEIGGWAIIIAWLVIGVRRPLMRWFKERARKREELENEQIAG